MPLINEKQLTCCVYKSTGHPIAVLPSEKCEGLEQSLAIVPALLVVFLAAFIILTKCSAVARKTSTSTTHVPIDATLQRREQRPNSPSYRRSLTQQEILDRIRLSSAATASPRVAPGTANNGPEVQPSSTNISLTRDGLVAMEWRPVTPEPQKLPPPAYTPR
ncbi:hypothetical protein BKA70DRAFT_1409039 [Coprinopsis sp. MPI-PUGE-AT-0042]|nr:hypothetical protein BKA70DRAFT_1409039 [Coprinopsis sp. MPI-PUGE-AT-0042]